MSRASRERSEGPRRARPDATKESGLTLIELAVVLTILLVLGAVVYPPLGNVLQVLAAKGTSDEVVSVVRLARQNAVSTGSNFCIDFGPTPSQTYVIRDVGGSTTTCTGPVVESGLLRDAVMVAAITDAQGIDTGHAIIFDPRGIVQNFAVDNPAVTLRIDTMSSLCPGAPPQELIVTIYGGVRVRAGGC